MDVLRTPDDRFRSLDGYGFAPHYLEVDGLRIHYVDEGPPGAAPILLLHGEPSWSYLYRRLIPALAGTGRRVIAPDLVGFGRSDKPVAVAAHTYANHVAWIRSLVTTLNLRSAVLVCQDWGGLIGLRVLAEDPDRFGAVVAANTGLPTGDHPMPEAWWQFRNWVAETEDLPISFLVNAGCTTELSPQVMAAYDAPFPDAGHKAGPRALPQLIPTTPEDPAAKANRAAWEFLSRWQKPFLCAFSDNDPITRDAGPLFQRLVPGAQHLDHPTIAGAGHFLQEDAGEQLAGVVGDFVSRV